MRILITMAVCGVLAGLAGCGSIPTGGGPLTHHVAVTLDDQRCMAASRWGSLSITGDINDRYCRAIVEGRYARELLRLMGLSPRPPVQAPAGLLARP